MASNQDYVEYVTGQINAAGAITARKMFGEYAIYCNGQVVGLVCDNRFYVKPTVAGGAFIGDVMKAPAYPGAKPSFVVDDHIDDRDWMSGLIAVTVRELDAIKARANGKKRSAGRRGNGSAGEEK